MTIVDDLKSDWKSLQKPESIAVSEKNISSVVDEFNKIQQKTKFENIICSILFILTIAALWCMVSFMDEKTLWVYSGVVILSVEMIVATGFAWYRNSLKKWSSVQSDTCKYLSAAIKKLKYRKFMAVFIIPVYSILLITGINLVYVDVLGDLSLALRWVIHLGVSVLLAGYVSFEINRRLKKEREEIDPLIKELKRIKNSLESEKQ